MDPYSDHDAQVAAYLTDLVRRAGVSDVEVVPIDGVWTFVADRSLLDHEREAVEEIASRFIQGAVTTG